MIVSLAAVNLGFEGQTRRGHHELFSMKWRLSDGVLVTGPTGLYILLFFKGERGVWAEFCTMG